MTSEELRGDRAGLISRTRAKWAAAEARAGGPNAEDKHEFDRAMDAADDLLARAKAVERQKREALARGRFDPGYSSRADLRHWMRTGEARGECADPRGRLAHLQPSFRDTIVGTDAKGGYLVAPLAVSNEIVRSMAGESFIRGLARVRPLNAAKKLGVRRVVTQMADFDWTGETTAVTEDTTMALGRRDLEPRLSSKLVKVSMQTLAVALDADEFLRDELARKFAMTEEKAFLTGNGSGKPLGVFVADAAGISTARDVSTGNTTTAITADGLIEAKFSINSGYWRSPSFAWIFSQAAVKNIRKLKVASSGGNDLEYLWQPGLTEGAPDKILDVPYHISDFAPATFTAGLYVGVIGDFRQYWIAEVPAVSVQRLDERYAATNEIGFIGRMWVDGAPVQEEAFARVKLAAA